MNEVRPGPSIGGLQPSIRPPTVRKVQNSTRLIAEALQTAASFAQGACYYSGELVPGPIDA